MHRRETPKWGMLGSRLRLLGAELASGNTPSPNLPNVIIIIIITKEYDYGGVMSEDCKDTLQTK